MTPENGRALLRCMHVEQQHLEKQVQEGCAVLPLLEAQVVHAACCDPGAVLLPHLVLPMLRQDIEAKVLNTQVHQAMCVHTCLCLCVCLSVCLFTSVCLPLSVQCWSACLSVCVWRRARLLHNFILLYTWMISVSDCMLLV